MMILVEMPASEILTQQQRNVFLNIVQPNYNWIVITIYPIDFAFRLVQRNLVTFIYAYIYHTINFISAGEREFGYF